MMDGMRRQENASRAGTILLIAGAVLCAASPAFAERPTEQCDVLYDIAAETEPGLHRIMAGKPRTHFLKSDGDSAGCPSMEESCAERAYLVAGDPVVVTEIAGDFACSAFTAPKGDKGETMGWLPRAALEEMQTPVPAVTDWLGRWQAGAWREINITAAAEGNVELEGTAYWGADDPGRRERGAVNTGDLSATAKPGAGKLAFSLDVDGETRGHDADPADSTKCRVRVWLLGPYLAVADNMQCGGANVSFTGIYRRR
jgi:hypothetical protein